MTTKKISLNDCMEAQYPVPPGQFITCRKGHELNVNGVHIRNFEKYKPMVYKICQGCTDFNDADS